MEVLGPALALGFLGSGHCLGMCGVFAATVGSACEGAARRRFAVRMGAYVAGKTLSYVFLGVLLASAGRAWLDTPALDGLRRLATGLAAVAVVFVALPLLGLPWPRRRAGAPKNPWRIVTRVLRGGFDAARRTGGARGALLLGFVNGFLPCGLVVAALLLAMSQESVLAAAAAMAVFGSGTAPALLLPAALGGRLSLSARPVLRRALGVALLVSAAPLVLRVAAPARACHEPEGVSAEGREKGSTPSLAAPREAS